MSHEIEPQAIRPHRTPLQGEVAAHDHDALTRFGPVTSLFVMRKRNPIELMLQVLSLAALSFALMAGSAFAHGASHHGRSAAPVETISAEARDALGGDEAGTLPAAYWSQAENGHVGAAPCSGDSPTGHAPQGDCCSIACHAALAAPGVDSPGAVDPPDGHVLGLTDRLEGRSSDRTERPPKRG
jgi:hypothetical protein